MSTDVISSVERIGHVDFKTICESMFVFNVRLTVPFKDLSQEPIRFFPIPSGYTPTEHHLFFSLPLHTPSQVVLEQYLDAIMQE
jgi:hypothetical protein